MLDPQIITLDEPFAGVHPKLQESIYSYINKAHTEGQAIILISHDMEIYMEGGRIDGTPTFRLIDLGISYIPQHTGVFRWMTVEENI